MPIESTQTQARKFLVAAKELTKRSHAAASNFNNIVEEGKKKLANLLEEKAVGVYARSLSTRWITSTYFISSTRRNNELRDALTTVLLNNQQDKTEMDEKDVKQPTTSKSTASAMYQSAKSKISSSRELLGRYERASQQIASGEGSLMIESEFGKDSQKLQRILDKKGEKVKLEVHGLLNEDSRYSKEEVKGDASELDTDLWNRFAVGEAKEENVETLSGRKGETWAVVAKSAQRGVRRTVKYLPEDGK